MKKKEEFKLTGFEFSEKFGIKMVNPKGWLSTELYNTQKITKDEYCLRIFNSEIEKPLESSRRDINKFKQDFYQKK